MINSVDLKQQNIKFSSKPKKEKKAKMDTYIMPNTVRSRIDQDFQKTTNAFLYYPIKGLQGDINSNFYEFLSMGIIPYLTGSAMFMLVFNCVNKFLKAKGRQISPNIGNKMALGVVLYGVFKTLSKHLVTTPVRLATGVDTEMPYQNKVCNLPKYAGEDANVDITLQQRKVFDSNEFYRKDLLVKGEFDGYEADPNADKYELSKKYFDQIAKKVGLGENLNDSMTEASPIIQNIVATSSTAKSLSSYAWAALGVGLATQDSWIEFFNSIKNRNKYSSANNETLISKLGNKLITFGKNTINITKTFCKSFADACKSFWKGKNTAKHAGKIMTLFTVGLTTLLTANTIIRAKNMAKNKNKNTIDKTKESTVI